MKIAITTPFEEQVPPQKYGGTELVVSLLAREYVNLGHEVYLLASGDSITTANLIPVVPISIRNMSGDKSKGSWREFWKYTGMAKIIEEIRKIKPDLIHNNLSWRLIAFENIIDSLVISTLHGPISSVHEIETFRKHKEHPFVSISDNQRKAFPDLNYAGTVYNGIDVESFDFNPNISNRDYFLFLGRTSPEKGLAEIIQLVLKTEHKLLIAAKVDEVDQEYFEKKVKPYIDDNKIKFLGEVGHEEKVKLLRGAKGLLLWLNWEEPFGLVVVEAAACGTPVIVNRRGSMSELIIDNSTGYLVNSLNEMKIKMNEVNTIDPHACRYHAESNFTARIMAEKYLTVARKLLKS